MAKKTQSLPHHGVKNGYTRKNNIVCLRPASQRTDKDEDGKETITLTPPQNREFHSISAAKRYMRTGGF